VSTNEWWIDSDFVLGAAEKWHYDGTNIYARIQPVKALPESLTEDLTNRFPLGRVRFDSAKSNITVHVYASTDGNPLGHAGVNVPWLAFCSGRYLARLGRLIPPPVATLRGTPDAFSYIDKTVTFTDDLGLPQTLELYTNNTLYEQSITRFNEERFRANRPVPASPYRDGLLKFQYSVTSATNVLGWNIPLSFEYLQNELSGIGKWAPRYGGIGEVTSIRKVPRPGGVIPLDSIHTVVDWRFRDAEKHVDALTYRSSNAFVMGTNDPTLQAQFVAKVKRMPRPTSVSQQRIRVITTSLLWIALVIPAIVLFWRNYGKQRQNRGIL
jgi:hypothetical protein